MSWRCFHCDEVFLDADKAQEHFGYSQYSKPGCLINLAEYRRMERVHRAHCAEDTELLRALAAKDAQMRTAVQRAEEEGYARGMADMRALLEMPE